MFKPQEIVLQAIQVLKEKAHKWLDILNEKEESSPGKDLIKSQ